MSSHAPEFLKLPLLLGLAGYLDTKSFFCSFLYLLKDVFGVSVKLIFEVVPSLFMKDDAE